MGVSVSFLITKGEVKMKTIKNFVLITLVCLTQLVLASGSYTDNARVISVEDIYRDHTIKHPYQDCYTKEFRRKVSDDSVTNEIFGSIIGGVIGNQFGGGRGKKVMTAAGALLGASIAHDGKRKGYETVNKQVCETKYTYSVERRFIHYLVKYEYSGHVYLFTTGKKPGANIRVHVRITPK